MLRTTHWVLGAWIILCGGAVVQAGPMFMGLGFSSHATGVSADGRVVVGIDVGDITVEDRVAVGVDALRLDERVRLVRVSRHDERPGDTIRDGHVFRADSFDAYESIRGD